MLLNLRLLGLLRSLFRCRSVKRAGPSRLLITLLTRSALAGVALSSGAAIAVGTGQVKSGEIQGGPSINGGGRSNLVIQQSSPNAVIEWNNFDINKGESVTFRQPSPTAATLNRVVSGSSNATQILGALNANGRIFIVNPSGVVFGQGASVDVGGLVASTLSISDHDFNRGVYTFASPSGMVPSGIVKVEPGVNITAKSFVALLGANSVTNGGNIIAGTDPKADSRGIALASGKAVTIQLGQWDIVIDPTTLTTASIENTGDLVIGESQRDGSILLNAQGADVLMAALLRGKVSNLSHGTQSTIALKSSGGTSVGRIGGDAEIYAAAGRIEIDGRNVRLAGSITAGTDETSSPVSVTVGSHLTSSVTQTEASAVTANGTDAAINIAAKKVLALSGALLAPSGQISLDASILDIGLLLPVSATSSRRGIEVLAKLPLYTEDGLNVYVGKDGNFYEERGEALHPATHLYDATDGTTRIDLMEIGGAGSKRGGPSGSSLQWPANHADGAGGNIEVQVDALGRLFLRAAGRASGDKAVLIGRADGASIVLDRAAIRDAVQKGLLPQMVMLDGHLVAPDALSAVLPIFVEAKNAAVIAALKGLSDEYQRRAAGMTFRSLSDVSLAVWRFGQVDDLLKNGGGGNGQGQLPIHAFSAGNLLKLRGEDKRSVQSLVAGLKRILEQELASKLEASRENPRLHTRIERLKQAVSLEVSRVGSDVDANGRVAVIQHRVVSEIPEQKKIQAFIDQLPAESTNEKQIVSVMNQSDFSRESDARAAESALKTKLAAGTTMQIGLGPKHSGRGTAQIPMIVDTATGTVTDVSGNQVSGSAADVAVETTKVFDVFNRSIGSTPDTIKKAMLESIRDSGHIRTESEAQEAVVDPELHPGMRGYELTRMRLDAERKVSDIDVQYKRIAEGVGGDSNLDARLARLVRASSPDPMKQLREAGIALPNQKSIQHVVDNLPDTQVGSPVRASLARVMNQLNFNDEADAVFTFRALSLRLLGEPNATAVIVPATDGLAKVPLVVNLAEKSVTDLAGNSILGDQALSALSIAQTSQLTADRMLDDALRIIGVDDPRRGALRALRDSGLAHTPDEVAAVLNDDLVREDIRDRSNIAKEILSAADRIDRIADGSGHLSQGDANLETRLVRLTRGYSADPEQRLIEMAGALSEQQRVQAYVNGLRNNASRDPRLFGVLNRLDFSSQSEVDQTAKGLMARIEQDPEVLLVTLPPIDGESPKARAVNLNTHVVLSPDGAPIGSGQERDAAIWLAERQGDANQQLDSVIKDEKDSTVAHVLQTLRNSSELNTPNEVTDALLDPALRRGIGYETANVVRLEAGESAEIANRFNRLIENVKGDERLDLRLARVVRGASTPAQQLVAMENALPEQRKIQAYVDTLPVKTSLEKRIVALMNATNFDSVSGASIEYLRLQNSLGVNQIIIPNGTDSNVTKMAIVPNATTLSARPNAPSVPTASWFASAQRKQDMAQVEHAEQEYENEDHMVVYANGQLKPEGNLRTATGDFVYRRKGAQEEGDTLVDAYGQPFADGTELVDINGGVSKTISRESVQ